MPAKGKRRPCCFDRPGMYRDNLNCPLAADGDTQESLRRWFSPKFARFGRKFGMAAGIV